MAELPPLKYGKVVGRFLANIADGPDINDLPEFVPLVGTITFTAEVPKVLVATATPKPATFVQLPDHYVCSLDEFGYITWRGQPGVRLVAPTAVANPNSWTWRVSFDLSYDGKRVPMDSFSFEVPEYIPGPNPADPDTGSVGLVDLALVSPVPGSTGNAVVRGVSVNSVGLSGTALVFGLDNGTFLPPVTVPAITDATNAATAAAASASSAAASATAAQNAVNSFDLDIGTVTTVPNGTPAAANVFGGPPAWTLDLTIPAGPTGSGAPDATASVKGILQLAGDLGGTAAAPTVPNKMPYVIPTSVKTAAYSAAPFDLIPVDCTGGSVTVSLPSAPADKTIVAVTRLDSSGNSVFVNRSGTDRFSQSGTGPTQRVLAVQYHSIVVQYQSSAGVWHVISDYLPVDALDSWYAPRPRQINTTNGLQGGGDLSANRTLSPVYGSSAGTVCEGNDSRLSDARTPTAAGQVYDFVFVAQTGTRATGAGNVLPQGIKLRRNIRISEVTYRGNTASASGTLDVELRKNGSTVAGTGKSIAVADQTAGGVNATATGTFDFDSGDVLTVHVTAVGGTPGQNLSADIKAVTR